MSEEKKSVIDEKTKVEEQKEELSEEKGAGVSSEDMDEILDFDEIRGQNDKESKEKTDEKTVKKPEKVSEDKEDGKASEDRTHNDTKEDKKASEDNKKKSEAQIQKNSKEDMEESEVQVQKDSKEDKKESEAQVQKSSKEDKQEPEKKSNAISQSKRLADAKAAESGKENVTNPPKGHKALWITLGTIAGLLLIAYITGFVYFSGHFYQDVAINGINVSNMNEEAAKNTLDIFYKDYKLTLKTIDNQDVVIDGKDIAMQVSLHDDFGNCLKQQQPYIWFVNMFKHHDYEIGADTSWDEKALSDLYESMDILNEKNMIEPEDAYVGYVDGKLTIVKEVVGTTIQMDTFKKVVEENLKNVQSTLNLAEQNCYKVPKVYDTDENIIAEMNAKEEFAKNEIKIQLDDLTLEPGMELYDEVLEKNGDGYRVSEKLVEKYVKNLADEYDTLGKERTFTTSFSSKKVNVLGDAFGYEINQEETTDALYKALTAGKPAIVSVSFNNKGYTLQGENDIGNTYIEVNLSEQRVIGYKNGRKIAEGDCVSGNESAGHGTCVGLFAIQGKQSPAVLRGEKVPKTKTVTKKKKGKKVKVQETTMEYEYESPVTFWMPFSGGIGLHDAAGWRSQYGGSIYYYSGSHGCVNLPYDLAQSLYENFEIGDPVIVYFWDNENRK